MKRTPRPEPGASVGRSVPLAVLGLATLSFFAFRGVTSCDFVNFDDDLYVTQNAQVARGITPANLAWTWSTFHASNWHPLTWMSLQLDATVYGLNPVGFHLTNVFLHTLNALLLFLLLHGMTGAFWRSTVVAAVFAVHPLHVESVAWITERKDLLSALFALLTLFAYRRYVARPSWGTFLLVAVGQILSLLCKPMLVTLPALLLLLDWWPLDRWQGPSPGAARLVLEKIPFLLISVASALVTVRAQSSWASVVSLESVPYLTRLGNSMAAVVAYVGQTFWPLRLAIHYPLVPVSFTGALGAGLLILGITGSLFWLRRPPLLVGWLWFLASLVPVIGLVQVGDQSRADRYTYLPHIGLFIALVWGTAELFDRWRLPHAVRLGVACAVILGAAALTTRQVAVWQGSETLWQHALNVLEPAPSWKVLYNLGSTLLRDGLEQCARATHLLPGPNQDLCRESGRRKLDSAGEHLERALALSVGGRAQAMTRAALSSLSEAKAECAKTEQSGTSPVVEQP